MSAMLLELVGNMTFNRTVFPPHLIIHDDLLIYKKGRLFGAREVTISYNQIARITLNKGLFFAGIEVETTGAENIVVRFVSKKLAQQAKKIIDQKIYHSHAKHHDSVGTVANPTIQLEKTIGRLHELFTKGQIDEKEYNKRKKQVLGKL